VRGLSTNVSYGPQIATTGEVVLPAPAAGGSQITLKALAAVAGNAPLQISSTLVGQTTLIINNSVTTGGQTATFAAANRPGNALQYSVTATAAPSGGAYVGGNLNAVFPGATSSAYTIVLSTGQVMLGCTFTNNSIAFVTPSTAITGSPSATFIVTFETGPAGWLPILCDGTTYYTPIWHGNQFSPYKSNPTAIGEMINATTVTLNGNGSTSVTGGSAVPSSWFIPNTASIGSGYFINIAKTGGLSGVGAQYPVTATAAPSGGAYTGGNLTANWNGTTASTYTLQLSTGQVITGCTFTNGAVAFTTPATSINTTPTTALLVGPSSAVWNNITASGLTINENCSATYNANYTLSSSITGTPVVASGTIQLQGGNGVQSPTYSGASPLILGLDGTASLNAVATANWFSPTTANTGSNAWINITRTGGTGGINFSAAQGSFTAITGGLAIGLTGNGQRTVTGTYQISANSAGTLVVGSGTISLTASGVNNTNWSGNTPLVLVGDGTSTLGGSASTNWFSPTTANTGSLYWIDITRTSGTTGVNFSAAQGSWTNITNSSLTIDMSGTSGNVGTVTVNGSYQLSNSASGSPVLGSGTISLSLSGLTLLHVYTTGTNATETIPSGTSTVKLECWGSGGGGGSGSGSGCTPRTGGGGGGGGYSRVTFTSMGGQVGHTYKYTIGAVGGTGGGAGSAGTIVAGTVTGFSTITCNGGGGGGNEPGSGAGGAGGTVTNANAGATNTTGNAGATGGLNGSGNGGAGISGNQSGDGSPHGGGGQGGVSASQAGITAGSVGAAVFFYS
jgi:hypothetical protein